MASLYFSAILNTAQKIHLKFPVHLYFGHLDADALDLPEHAQQFTESHQQLLLLLQ